MTTFKLDKQVEDLRGKMFFFSHGNKYVNLIEMKKGLARGGHYHNYDQDHIMISGKIEVRQENVMTSKEDIKIVTYPSTIHIPKNTAHLFIALEDSVFFEVFDYQYKVTNYPKYRHIVDEKMKLK